MNKTFLCLTFLVVTLSIVSCQRPDYSEQMGPIIDQYVGVWNGDSLTVLDKIADKNFELRIIPSFETITSDEKLKERITRTRTSFPDFLVKKPKDFLLAIQRLYYDGMLLGHLKVKTKCHRLVIK